MPERPNAIEIGYWLSSEEHGALALVDLAVRAEAAGFGRAMISDHFHPWTAKQGHAPFVWGVLGAIAQATTRLRLATGVTAPILRVHPAIVAHAAGTAAVLAEERFELGLGSGERLNEHVVGAPWPRPGVRRKMLAEAIDIIRRLLGGEQVNLEGDYFRVEHAQLFTRPAVPPPILLAVSGRRSAQLAGRSADGIISYGPDPQLVEQFEAAGGAGKPRIGQLHLCWAPSADQARRTALEWWPNGALPPRLNSELAQPQDFAALADLVDEAAVAKAVVCGADPAPFVTAVSRFASAGYDRVYLHQVGPDQVGFLRFWEEELRPALGA
jgi:coenzyme F420-dependent glucose-6-phosphate dehydrogenase